MAAIDIGKLANDIQAAISGAVGKDITVAEGFSKDQVTLLAKHAERIAADHLKGVTTDAQRDDDLDDLKDMVRSFAEVLQGLTVIAVEKAWNAAVAVIWKTVGTAIGVVLPVP